MKTRFKKGVTDWRYCRWAQWLRRHDDRAKADLREEEERPTEGFSSWKTGRPWWGS